jgi:hypothetical protein
MNIRLTFLRNLAAVAVIGALAGCAGTASNNAATAMSQKEMMLHQAGFKAKTLTTPQQQQALAKLPAGKVSMAKFKGVVYYVYPTSTKNQIFVGKKPQYQAYKNMMMAAQKKQAAPAPAPQQQATAQAANPNAAIPVMNVDPDPRGVAVEVYDGMGPMDDGSHW